MKLGDWLKQRGMTQAAFADLIASDQGHVSDLVHGKVKPKLESVALIQMVTEGGVAMQDWLNEQKPKRVKLDRLKAAVKKAVR